ncbi:MAG: YicC family protein [Acidobacteria bacterium]|nr:YicC family protein [Acidobacteriota bacterium]
MSAPIRSMTGFASVTGRASETLGFTLSAKSVNHRFLDPHLRLPGGMDALEMELRKLLKEHVRRGHVEITLQLERSARTGVQVNLPLLRVHVDAYRAAATNLELSGEPDLNALLRLPGALSGDAAPTEDQAALQQAVIEVVPQLLAELNTMREREGAALADEMRAGMGRIHQMVTEVRSLRAETLPQIYNTLRERLQSLLADTSISEDRILTEAAMLAERGDVDEEMVRLDTHVQHFIEHLNTGGEIGKKLDFLLQEFNREANTLLSKTGGSAHSMRITELGLAVKSEIERAREQVQNLE